MNLEQALELVQDHIRIGKGMEFNGVPEALEMVVEELAVTQKALELACERLYDFYEHDCRSLCPIKEDACKFPYRTIGDCWKSIKDWMLTQAKEAANDSSNSDKYRE